MQYNTSVMCAMSAKHDLHCTIDTTAKYSIIYVLLGHQVIPGSYPEHDMTSRVLKGRRMSATYSVNGRRFVSF